MTTDLMKDLAQVIRPLSGVQALGVKNVDAQALGKLAADCIDFLCEHHATIQQNAEAALRLRALEQAMRECGKTDQYIRQASFVWLNKRADELLREWAKEKGNEC